MHFLVTAIGSYGDVHPMAGLAERLRLRGHDVTLAANPYFADIAERIGVPLLPLGTVDDYERLIANKDIWHPRRGLPLIFREGALRHMRSMYESLSSAYRPGETRVVCHMLDIAGRLLRETHAAKVARVAFAPASFWSDHRPPRLPGTFLGPNTPRWFNRLHLIGGDWLFARRVIGRPLNRFRHELGLPKVGRVLPDWWFDVDLTVAMFPEWFAPPQIDWPKPLACVGFPLWDGGGPRLSPELTEFLDTGTRPIVWTAGTANRHAAKFFAAAIDVCKTLDRRGILLTKFPEQLPRKLPATVRHESFVPLTKLLARTAVFVHHGGIGSSSQALAAGVPQLVVSLGFDQLDNADRLVELGVATAVRAPRLTVVRAASALERLLSDEVAARATEVATHCETDAIDVACDRLESLTP